MNKSDHDLLIDLAGSVKAFHDQYAKDVIRKDLFRAEAKLAQKGVCDAQNKWIRNIQRDVETLKNWRTGIVGGAAALMAYFKFRGKL